MIKCEIGFFDEASNVNRRLLGLINKKQLYDESRFITVKNTIEKQGTWVEVEHSIYKGDIHTLTELKAGIIITFDNVSLHPNKLILGELKEL